MGDVQLEHGYTRIANALLEGICKAPLQGRQLRVLLAVARLTYGWNRKSAKITGQRVADLAGVTPHEARRLIRQLVSMRVLISAGGTGSARTLAIRKSSKAWEIPNGGGEPQLGLFDGGATTQGARVPRGTGAPRGGARVPRRGGTGAPLPNRKTISKDSKDKSRRAAEPPDWAWALTLADLMIELLEPVPGARIPPGARSRWAREIVKMPKQIPGLRKLEDPAPTIEAGIRWVLGPDNVGQLYEVVVRSGNALLVKWPKIVAAARRHSAKARSPIDDVNEVIDRRRSERGKPTQRD